MKFGWKYRKELYIMWEEKTVVFKIKELAVLPLI